MQKDIKHWTITRLTSLPLVPLFLYFIGQSEYIMTKSRPVFITWLKEPLTTVCLILFIICGFWHAKLGMEEIIIDYIPSKGAQMLTLWVNALCFFLLGAASLYAVLAISFGNF
jgi:succinate dehydrogenase / fumarate reductase membrane anchor subunit